MFQKEPEHRTDSNLLELLLALLHQLPLLGSFSKAAPQIGKVKVKKVRRKKRLLSEKNWCKESRPKVIKRDSH